MKEIYRTLLYKWTTILQLFIVLNFDSFSLFLLLLSQTWEGGRGGEGGGSKATNSLGLPYMYTEKHRPDIIFKTPIFRLKTQLFCYGYSYCPHQNDDRKRNFSKTFSWVDFLENETVEYSGVHTWKRNFSITMTSHYRSQFPSRNFLLFTSPKWPTYTSLSCLSCLGLFQAL